MPTASSWSLQEGNRVKQSSRGVKAALEKKKRRRRIRGVTGPLPGPISIGVGIRLRLKKRDKVKAEEEPTSSVVIKGNASSWKRMDPKKIRKGGRCYAHGVEKGKVHRKSKGKESVNEGLPLRGGGASC